jgi:hypothetical protein
MKYSIYKEEFLKDQVELVSKVTKNWDNYGYPDLEQLKEVYSRETFTPDTRHYLFEEDKLIGFVASAVENKEEDIQYGSIQYPFVDKSDPEERKKIESELMNKAIETLKSNGVHVIRSVFSDKWPVDSVKSLYEEKETLQRQAIISDFRDIPTDEISEDILEIDMEKHLDVFHRGLIHQFPDIDEEQMIQILKRAHDSEGFVKRLLAIENDMVVTQGRAGTFDNQGFITIFAYHDDGVKYKKDIIKGLLRELKKKEDVAEVTLTHTYSDAAAEEGFEEFDLDFTSIKRYEIKLE